MSSPVTPRSQPPDPSGGYGRTVPRGLPPRPPAATPAGQWPLPGSRSGADPATRPAGRAEMPNARDRNDISDDYDDDFDDQAPGWRGRLRGVGVGLVWLFLAALLALGSAGVVAATEHSPASGARPELTWAADSALSGQLDANVSRLVRLSADVDVLGQMARAVISNLTQLNAVGLQAAWNDGDAALARINTGAAAIRSSLGCRTSAAGIDTSGMDRTYSGAVIGRFVRACQAAAAVDPLPAAWADLVFGSGRALEVGQRITEHDQVGEQALQLATKGDFRGALAKLATASAAIDAAQTLRDQLARIADVSTLTDWLNRTADMDEALRLLWQAMVNSKGKVTPQVSAALQYVSSAKAKLPADARVMSVVLFEMSQTLTGDGITIETAKGALGAAVNDVASGVVVGQ